MEYLSLTKPNFKSKIVEMKKYSDRDMIVLESITDGNNGSFVKSPWFKVLFGSAIALGATAAYFKIKAD